MKKSAIEIAQEASAKTRAAMLNHWRQLIEDQKALIIALDGRPAEIIAELAETRARYRRHADAAANLERRLFAEAATASEEKQAERMRKLKNRMRWIDATRKRVEALERSRAEIPVIEAQTERARLRLALLERELTDGAVINDTAARAGVNAVRRAQEDEAARLEAARIRAAGRVKSDRDRPTKEQIARRGIRSQTREGAFVLEHELPEPLLRMSRAGYPFEPRELKAAARYREDYRFGHDRAKMVGSYEPGVSGGAGAGEIPAAKLDAFERHRAAAACLPDQIRRVLDAVIIHEIDLATAAGSANRYAGEKARRSANGVLLTLGLEMLSAHYFKAFGE